jgi:hypothetical protein
MSELKNNKKTSWRTARGLCIAVALVAGATLAGCGKDDDNTENGNGNGNGNGNANTEITVPASVLLPVGPGTVTLAVAAPAGEAWTISGVPDWVELSARGGEGNGTLTVTTKAFHLSTHAREATMVVGGHHVKITQPPYVVSFPDLLHPGIAGYYFMVGSTNFTCTPEETGFATSPDDTGHYFQYGVPKGYTAGAAWDTLVPPAFLTYGEPEGWRWFIDVTDGGFAPLFGNADYVSLYRLPSAEDYGRLWGSEANPTGQTYPDVFNEVPYQWRAANEAGNKIAGMFIGENAEEATIADLKGTAFFPAAGYLDARSSGALTDYGVKGYYLCWNVSPVDYIRVFVVSADGIEVWTDPAAHNWHPRHGASIRTSFEKLITALD